MHNLRSILVNTGRSGSKCYFANSLTPFALSVSRPLSSLVSYRYFASHDRLRKIDLHYHSLHAALIKNNEIHDIAIRRYYHNDHEIFLKQRKQKWQESIDQSDEIKKLLKQSKLFLENYDQISSVAQKTKEIQQLVSQWNKIWGAPSTSIDKPKVSDKKNDNENITISFDGDSFKKSYLSIEGVEIVDKLAHKFLDEIENIMKEGKKITPISNAFQPLFFALGGWSKAQPQKYSGVKAQELLERMDYIHEKFGKSQSNSLIIQPTYPCYGAVINAWSNTIDDIDSNINGAEMAVKLLNKMEKIYKIQGSKSLKPNLIVYNTCLHAYAQRGMIDEVEALIEKLEASEDDELIPDVYTYSICMNAYEKGYIREGLPVEKRAENLLIKMIKKYEQTGDRRFMPNQFTFGTAISIFANSRSKDGALEAHRILSWLIDLYQKEMIKISSSTTSDNDKRFYPILQPTEGHFVTVFLAYSKRNHNLKLACQKIGELIVEMKRLHDAGLSKVKLSYKVWSTYALVKLNDRDSEQKVSEVLSRMEEIYLNSEYPDFVINNYGYNALMNSIARSSTKDRSTRVREVMNRMNKLYANTGSETLLPDKVSYTCLMKAIVSDRKTGFVDECKAILKMMEEEYEKGNIKLKPDMYTYGTVINAISIGDFPEESERMLDKMENLAAKGDKDLYPNIVCYNTVMNAYGKRRRSDASLQVERIFHRIDESREKGNFRLEHNVYSYSIVIDALGRSRDKYRVEKAEALFNRLLEKYNETQSKRFEPSRYFWASLMFVYAESDMKNKADKVLDIIKRMEKAGEVVASTSYNILLKACAKTKVQNKEDRNRVIEISRIAVQALNSKAGLKVESYAYNSLFWIANNFIDDPEEKQATFRQLIKSCCNDGEMNKLLLETVRRILPHDLFLELIGNDKGVKIEDLPCEWRRNTHHNNRDYGK